MTKNHRLALGQAVVCIEKKRDSSNHCPFGASVHNGLMNNSGFSAVTHISRSHICDSLIFFL